MGKERISFKPNDRKLSGKPIKIDSCLQVKHLPLFLAWAFNEFFKKIHLDAGKSSQSKMALVWKKYEREKERESKGRKKGRRETEKERDRDINLTAVKCLNFSWLHN
jgi:hypothetical protein